VFADAGGLLPLIVGGSGLAGIGGLGATLYLLRAQRDDTVARAAKSLLEGSTGYTEGLRADLEAARAEIRSLSEKVEGMTTELRAARQDADSARTERDEAIARCDEIAALLGGRRFGDGTWEAS
jgi:outer membrane murein-binding lipoprotein Lpp